MSSGRLEVALAEVVDEPFEVDVSPAVLIGADGDVAQVVDTEVARAPA